jgi:hypothetical protein
MVGDPPWAGQDVHVRSAFTPSSFSEEFRVPFRPLQVDEVEYWTTND